MSRHGDANHHIGDLVVPQLLERGGGARLRDAGLQLDGEGHLAPHLRRHGVGFAHHGVEAHQRLLQPNQVTPVRGDAGLALLAEGGDLHDLALDLLELELLFRLGLGRGGPLNAQPLHLREHLLALLGEASAHLGSLDLERLPLLGDLLLHLERDGCAQRVGQLLLRKVPVEQRLRSGARCARGRSGERVVEAQHVGVADDKARVVLELGRPLDLFAIDEGRALERAEQQRAVRALLQLGVLGRHAQALQDDVCVLGRAHSRDVLGHPEV
mmetsp:Transcript_35611/g.82493  ORF Transcript_35611/g.82493 Transcript_35611/m.82493 type:complete len:270 (-) Transcript_35611:1924-2733(-)